MNDKLQKLFDLNETALIFEIGLGNRLLQKAERVYFDALDFTIQQIEEYVLSFFKEKFINYNELYICLLNHTFDEKMNSFDVFKENLTCLGIDSNVDFYTRNLYDKEDEWFLNYFVFKADFSVATKLFEGLFNRERPHEEDKYLKVEPFFISFDLNQVLNVYDSRGMDYLEIDKLHFT